ncbi:MAG: DUF2911 domain-containing protein [Acidobacteria bacterium]|nr:DUF2911 domain-containing protein [Acidobacteriota bacterium]
MKRVLTIFGLSLAALVVAMAHLPGRDAASVELGKGKVTIDYGTPNLNGRNLDEMIKPGVPWRMGMNEATTLETSVALDLSGRIVASGKYTLFARPDESGNWVLLISSNPGNRFNPASVVAEVPLHFERDQESVDVLKISLEKNGDGAMLSVAWGNYRLKTGLNAAA